MVGLKTSLNASPLNESRADALLHLKPNGTIDVYSGGAHHGVYATADTLGSLTEVLEFNSENFVIITGDNPVHLPGFLGHNLNHMSFTDERTTKKAASMLKAELEGGRSLDLHQPKYIVEDGISHKTYEMIHSLKPEGIIVAVRQVI